MRKIPLAGRLPHPDRDDLGEAERAVYDALLAARSSGAARDTVVDADGRLAGPFNAMVHASPQVGMALSGLGAALRFQGTLSDRARELAILTVAATRSSRFEWFAHAGPAAAAGLTDDMLEGLARGDAGFFDRADAVVHRAVIELLAGDLSQQAWEDGCEVLGVRGVVDLVIFVGYYDTLATMLRAFRVPLPEEDDS